MILVDSSAWIELLRASGTPAHHTLRRALRSGADLAVTEPVVMEVLAGARSDADLLELRDGLLSLPVVPIDGLGDFERAAGIYRACRGGGETPGSLMDCLIAAVAIRANGSLLHADSDFEAIARHTELRIHRAR